ncbi:MAG TPA: hypothetical protein VFD17_00125 [Clostridia bacterium]|nr:hypothetical protein [Clostridia bacterium]
MPVGKKQSDARVSYSINKETLDFHAGVREGRCKERGYWVQALSNMKEIEEALLGRIIGEVAKLYNEEEDNNVDEN